jgi:hypothetical protein
MHSFLIFMVAQNEKGKKTTVGKWLYELCNELYIYFTLVVVDKSLREAFQLLWEGPHWRLLWRFADLLPASALAGDPYIVYAFNCMNFNSVKISPTCEKVLVLPYNNYRRAMEYWECRRRYIMSEYYRYHYSNAFGFSDPCAPTEHVLHYPKYREEYRCVYLDVWRGKRQSGYRYVVFDADEKELTPEKMAGLIAGGRAYVI